MKDDLDEILDSYAVRAEDCGKLVDKIVARAETERARVPANRNVRRAGAYRASMLAAAALAGFWLGQTAAKTQEMPQTPSGRYAAHGYLDRMVMGPASLNDLEL